MEDEVFVPPRECWAEGMLTNCSGGAPGQGCHMGFAAPTGMVRAGLRKRFPQLEVAEPESHSNLRAQGQGPQRLHLERSVDQLVSEALLSSEEKVQDGTACCLPTG